MKSKLKILGYTILTLACIWSFAHWVLPAWFWHPVASQVCRAVYKTPTQVRDCISYNAWSGILGSFLVSVPQWFIAGALIGRHHNCHHKGCWDLGHKHPVYGWPACKEHWHEVPDHIDTAQVAKEQSLAASVTSVGR